MAKKKRTRTTRTPAGPPDRPPVPPDAPPGAPPAEPKAAAEPKRAKRNHDKAADSFLERIQANGRGVGEPVKFGDLAQMIREGSLVVGE